MHPAVNETFPNSAPTVIPPEPGRLGGRFRIRVDHVSTVEFVAGSPLTNPMSGRVGRDHGIPVTKHQMRRQLGLAGNNSTHAFSRQLIQQQEKSATFPLNESTRSGET